MYFLKKNYHETKFINIKKYVIGNSIVRLLNKYVKISTNRWNDWFYQRVGNKNAYLIYFKYILDSDKRFNKTKHVNRRGCRKNKSAFGQH